jgi:hypothetical protein
MKNVFRYIAFGSLCWLPSIALAGSLAPSQSSSQQESKIRYAPWSFVEDFNHGIPGWMSFPLAQDIGYDPSIYTSSLDGKYALVRDVIAEGQSGLRVGLLQPMSFRITPGSVIRLRYQIDMSGKTGPGELVLGTKSGKKYSASLSVEKGEHQIEIRGSLLGVPSSGNDVEIVVIEADTTGPILGAHNRLVIKDMRIEAETNATVPVVFPRLERSATLGTPVAVATVKTSDPVLPIQLGPESGNTEITLYDGSGRKVKTEAVGKGPVSLGSSPAPGLWRAGVTNGGAESDFRFLVLGDVPPHPRLLLTPERLEQLRSHMPSDALKKVVREQAAFYAAQISYNPKAGDNIHLMSPDSVIPGLPNYSKLLTTYGNAIVLNALDYRLRNSPESLEVARRALLTVSQWPTWTPSWFAAHGLHTYYQTGMFSQWTAFGYDLIASELSPSEKSQIANAFYRNAITPAVEEYFSNNRMPLAASNHMSHAVAGAIADCIAVYGDVPDWDTRFAPALAKLMVSYENLLGGLFLGDGSEAEPAGYQDFAMEGLSLGAAALQQIGIRPNGTERMIQSFWWSHYIQYKPGYLLDTGDFNGSLGALSGYAWATENGGDPTLRTFYDSAISHSLKSIFKPGNGTPQYAPDMLDLVCCTESPKAVPSAPPSRLFPLRGSAALRSGWDQDATVISIRVGPWFNHEHHDEGSFQVAFHGEVLIGEAGYTEYYFDPRYQNYFTQAPGHNTVMLDNDAFSQRYYQGRYWKSFDHHPAVTEHVLGDGIDYLLADLAPAYDGSLKNFTREFFFLKPGLLLVHDRVSGNLPHIYSFMLHVPPGTAPSVNEAGAEIRGKGASVLIAAAGSTTHWKLEAAPIPVTAYENFDKDPVEPRSTFSLESAKLQDAAFTVGMQFLPTSSAAGTLKTFSTRNADGFSTDAGNVTALFRNSTGDLSHGEFSTDGGVLAVLSEGNQPRLFIGQARWLREKGHPVISSDVPVDAEIARNAKEETLNLFSAESTVMSIAVKDRVKTLSVDGKAIEPSLKSNLIEVKLNAGAHLVHIVY